MRIRFDKIKGIIRIYDGTRYLTLLGSEKYDKIRYLISLKSSTSYMFSHYSAKIKVYSFDSLPTEKALTFHNVIIHIKSVLNKDKNHYCRKIFLEKYSYELAKKNNHKTFFYSIIMMKFGKTEIAKEKFYAAKKTYKNLGC